MLETFVTFKYKASSTNSTSSQPVDSCLASIAGWTLQPRSFVTELLSNALTNVNTLTRRNFCLEKISIVDLGLSL